MIKIDNKFYFLMFLALLLIGSFYIDHSMRQQILNHLQVASGFYALCLLSTIYIFSNLFFIPLGFPINLLAGSLWGTIFGGLLINVLATFVAALSFLLARRFGNLFQKKFFVRNTRLQRLTSVINRYDWQFIAMARINPIIPFSLANYAFGLILQLSFRNYIIATILGNIIPCFVVASIGSAFKTFSLENADIRRMILQAGIVLLLISVMLTIKLFVTPEKEAPPNKDMQ